VTRPGLLGRAALVAATIVIVAACGRDDAPRPGAGSGESGIAKRGPDPEGPCTWVADDRCREHEALFAEAAAGARELDLGAAPAESGRLSAAKAYFVAVAPTRGKRITVTVEQLGAPPAGGTRFRVRRWEARVDGWKVAEDAFSTSTPGASFSQDVTPTVPGRVLIAVLAEPPTDFQVRLVGD